MNAGNSLVVQWLRLGAFTAEAQVQLLVREQRSREPHGQEKKNAAFTGQSSRLVVCYS